MRKDLIFKYLDTASSSLTRIHMDLLNQELNETSVQSSTTSDRNRLSSTVWAQVELDLFESQLENIMCSVRLLKENLKNLK